MEIQSFEYTYSAQRRKEVEQIRSKYLPEEADKMQQLRHLHSIPTRKAQASAIADGVVGALVLGTGMSLCLTNLGAGLGALAMPLGILTGLVGMAMTGAAYPIFCRVLKAERKKIAPEILRLTEELL